MSITDTVRVEDFDQVMTPTPARRPEVRTRPVAEPDPRQTMRRLPQPLQLPLTMLTGKPYAGQRPLTFTPTFHLVAAFADMALGVAITGTLLSRGAWWLLALPIGWALTLHGMRNLRMMIYHQCAHRNMYRRNRRLDAPIGRLAASLLLVQNFARYSAEHMGDHHALHHMTLKDPTVQAILLSLELRPGMTRRQMWRQLLAKLVSPRFHLAFSIGRCRSFLNRATLAERLTALGLYGGALAVSLWTGYWQLFLIGWLVPLFPLFQVSNTLRLCVKHTFPEPGIQLRKGREYFASLTNAIFLGEAAPAGRGALGWLRWVGRMALVHFPARYLVLTGDTVCHDFHHRHPSTRDWANYIFARQQDIDNGHPGWPAYREAWGLVAAINLMFDSLSRADAEEFDPALIRSVSKRELFAAFDD